MQQAAPRYSAYQRLQFDYPAPRVVRITMNNGKMNTADAVMHGATEPFGAYPNLKRWFTSINTRPAVARARAAGNDHVFKTERDEQALRALFPSNYARA